MNNWMRAAQEGRVGATDSQLLAVAVELLQASRIGVLVTDLDHRILALNAGFGRIFRVDPSLASRMEVEELRRLVYPRLRDPEAWRRQLEATYGDPSAALEDEVELIDDLITVVKRHSWPLRDAEGVIIGRIWTFEDVTSAQFVDRRREAMQAVNTYHHPDPAQVCRFVVEQVAEVFDSTCLLSIWSGDKMLYREVANPPPWLAHVRESQVSDTFCQVALRTVKPLFIQDGREDPRFCAIAPVASLGLTRYAGVPLCDVQGRAIGTLCFLDAKSRIPVHPEDLEFLVVMASRVSTELERERLVECRLADQRAQLARQEADLAVTREVLAAMNGGFELLGRELDREAILRSQAELLKGILNYESAAILELSDEVLTGVVAGPGPTEVVTLAKGDAGVICQSLKGGPRAFRPIETPSPAIRALLGSPHIILSWLPVDDQDVWLVLLGRSDVPPLDDQHHQTHLVALIDQIALLVTSARLHEDLRLANRELQEAQQQMIQSEKLSVVGALSASVAHDIRNILASISIECSLGGREPAETLERVEAHIERFSVLSHRLLSYARPRFLAREPIDLGAVLERATAMLSTQVKVTGVVMDVHIESDLPYVVADAHRVEHLFVNLMLNALQAMPTHDGVLSVSLVCEGSHLVVAVQDNGRGISTDTIDHVFEPFYSTRKDGFGLGLYSCKKIVDEHGWQIAVTSEVGKGSTFRIQIPVEDIE